MPELILRLRRRGIAVCWCTTPAREDKRFFRRFNEYLRYGASYPLGQGASGGPLYGDDTPVASAVPVGVCFFRAGAAVNRR